MVLAVESISSRVVGPLDEVQRRRRTRGNGSSRWPHKYNYVKHTDKLRCRWEICRVIMSLSNHFEGTYNEQQL